MFLAGYELVVNISRRWAIGPEESRHLSIEK